MIRRLVPVLGARLSLAVMLSLAGAIGRSARAQDTPAELREKPEILPDRPPDDTVPPSGDPSPSTTGANQQPVPDEATPPAALRLEAQLLGAMSFPFGGSEHGAAFGFAITYGAGWGEIPILIGLDFMSVGRSNNAALRDDVAGSPATRTTSDRLLDFDLWLRVQPPRWPIRPYAEGFVGAKLVRTNWSIARHDEATASGSDSAWTSALGWGVGVDFMGLFNAVAAFSLTLGMRRLHASPVELARPTIADGRAVASKREVAANETIFVAGLCGRYDFGEAE